MNFRNPKQQNFLEEKDIDSSYQESFTDEQARIITERIMRKEEPVVPEIPYADKMTFWDYMSDTQYGEFDPDTLSKPNTWVITSKGTWLVQSNKTGYYGAKKSDFGFPTLPEGKGLPDAFFDLAFGKIPYSILQQITAFFRDVMKKYNDAEAFVQVYWDLQEEKYVCHVPKQKVSKGSVQYDAQENLNVVDKKRYVFVYECHSHNSMDAFWSGTDNADEKELRVYGVFGRLDNEEYACLHRFFVGEKQANVDVESIFDIPKKEENSKYLVMHKNKQYLVNRDQLILDNKPKYIFHTELGEKMYVPVESVAVYKEPVEKVDFPQEWFSNVNIPTQVIPTRSTGGTYGGSTWGRNWDGGSGYWPEYPSSRQEALELRSQTQGYEQEGVEEISEEEAQEQYEMMAQEMTDMTDQILHFTTDFQDTEPTFVFLETIEQNMALKALEKAIQSYYYRSRKEVNEGPSDGRY